LGVKHVVGTVDEIPPGERKLVEVNGRLIGVFNVRGEFFAVLNRCPHQGGPLCQGNTHGFLMSAGVGEFHYSRPGEILRCPWHGWEFDIRTGQSYADPARTRVRSYPVGVRSGDGLGGGGEDGVGQAEQERIVAGGVHKTVVSGRTAGPFTAEKVPVSVEADYVVLILPR
jgi:3-phenylpropionate/trans-cinnamate dioxygenase ferredoxin subunit